jgi:hypothetical protein
VTVITHHRLQSLGNRCVAACACLVRSWQNSPVDEDVVCASWHGTSSGYRLREAEAAIGGKSWELDPDVPNNYEYVNAMLGESRWVIAQMSGGRLMQGVQAMPRRPVSPFGALSPVPGGGPLHAIVLVEADEAGLSYLDPFYLRDGQPFRLTREQFVHAWQGAVVISPVNSG